MRTDIAYEVSDLRTSEKSKLGPVGIVVTIPGGLWIETNNRRGYFLDVAGADEGQLVDRNDDGILEFNTGDGLILLTRLRLSNYKQRVYPYIQGNPGPFDSDDSVNQFFFEVVFNMGMDS